MSIQVDTCLKAMARGKLDYIMGFGIEACPNKQGIYRAFYEYGWREQERESEGVTCRKCSVPFDQDRLGKYGCPNCAG